MKCWAAGDLGDNDADDDDDVPDNAECKLKVLDGSRAFARVTLSIDNVRLISPTSIFCISNTHKIIFLCIQLARFSRNIVNIVLIIINMMITIMGIV